MNVLLKYFSQLSSSQIEKFAAFETLYCEWNEKINVISRKDIDHLYEKHVLHSLAIAKFIAFKKNTHVLDVGTGGGFPGIPLAIFFPESRFHLVDSIGKKIKVVGEVAEALKLSNVTAEQIRAEEVKEEFDFIVSRAVAPLKTTYGWTHKIISKQNRNTIPNGWIFLKGGDLKEEIFGLGKKVTIIPVSDFFEEEFFREKYIVYFGM